MNIQELVEYIARSLVEDPSQVEVKVTENQNAVNLELHVAPGDMGRVIGKGGRVANAIRTLVRVAAVRQGKRATLEVVDQAAAEKKVAVR
ncbi:MAG: KH domain-containing protein [Rudaea sp.]